MKKVPESRHSDFTEREIDELKESGVGIDNPTGAISKDGSVFRSRKQCPEFHFPMPLRFLRPERFGDVLQHDGDSTVTMQRGPEFHFPEFPPEAAKRKSPRQLIPPDVLTK